MDQPSGVQTGLPSPSNVLSLIYLWGHCTAPLSPLPRRPNRNSSYSIRPVTPLGSSFNFPFVRSIYWELALTYFTPGRADHYKRVSILWHSSTHHAHFRRHRTYQSSNSYPHPHREASLSNLVSRIPLKKLYAFLTSGEEYNIDTPSCISSDLITSGMFQC